MAASIFCIFNAVDFFGLSAQLNDWGGTIESIISTLTNAVTELRGHVLVQTGELETLRKAFITVEIAQTQSSSLATK